MNANPQEAAGGSDTPPPDCCADDVAPQSPRGPAEFFEDYADMARLALVRWAIWHIERGEARGISDQDALDQVIEATDALYTAITGGADDDAIEKADEALHCAITDAKEAAEDARRDYPAPTAKRRHRDAQAEEVETSCLRGWARAFSDIAHCFMKSREDPEAAISWCHNAARTLIFSRPPTLEDAFCLQ